MEISEGIITILDLQNSSDQRPLFHGGGEDKKKIEEK